VLAGRLCGAWALRIGGLGAFGETETMDLSDNGVSGDPRPQFGRDLTGAKPVVP
jgi:hypothetical protein